MRYVFIGCEVLFREFCHVAARAEPTLDVVMLPHGLHNTPAELRIRLQQEVDRLSEPPASRPLDPGSRDHDAILLGYALCSNGVAGLEARRIPLVIPRGHDCMTLLLGSKEAYQRYFDTHPGIYWYSAGWIERTLMPGRERYEKAFKEYSEKYGEDNAQYLMEMEQRWYKDYHWATYIDWGLPSAEHDRAFTRECATYLGWNYDDVKCDPGLFQDFVNGCWDEERFQVVRPGETLQPSYDNRILKTCGANCGNLDVQRILMPDGDPQ